MNGRHKLILLAPITELLISVIESLVSACIQVNAANPKREAGTCDRFAFINR